VPCVNGNDQALAVAQYGRMRDALNKTGRPITFSLCGWHPFYAPVGASLGNLWRIGPDDTNWHGVLSNINLNAPLAQYAGPGGFNDPCLLLAEDASGRQRVTELQSRAQFSMWAIMASPLLLSANVRHMSAYNRATYANAEVIAVDQDALGLQGTRVLGGDLQPSSTNTANTTNVWLRRLTGGRWALVLLNVGPTAATVVCDAACLAPTGLAGKTVAVRDLWAHATEPAAVLDVVEAKDLPEDGGHKMLLLTPATAPGQ